MAFACCAASDNSERLQAALCSNISANIKKEKRKICCALCSLTLLHAGISGEAEIMQKEVVKVAQGYKLCSV